MPIGSTEGPTRGNCARRTAQGCGLFMSVYVDIRCVMLCRRRWCWDYVIGYCLKELGVKDQGLWLYCSC